MAELSLSVVPGAAVDRLGPYVDHVLRARVTRKAIDGAANRAAIRLLGRALDVPSSTIHIVSGEHARRKRVVIEGLSQPELERRLRRLLD